MEIVSCGPLQPEPEALRKELASVAARVSGRKLGLVYLPANVDHAAFMSAARDGLGDAVVGATTAGMAFTERGCVRNGVVAAVFGGPGFDFATSVARDLGRDPEASIAAATEPVVDAARRRLLRSQSLFTLADAFACDGEVLVQKLQRHTPPHWHHFGCAAGDDWKFEKSYVFHGNEVLTDAAVLVGLFSDAPPSVGVRHGWCAPDHGREVTVTRMLDNVLLTLDDRPAVDVYREELIRLELARPDEDLIQTMARHELGAKTRHGQLKVRSPISVTPEGGLVLAGGLARGTMVRVLTASPEQLIEAARMLSRHTLAPMANASVRGALVFDCGARLQRLGDRYPEEVQAFLGGRSFPLIGTTGYGEFARYGGSVEGFHNATAVMAAW